MLEFWDFELETILSRKYEKAAFNHIVGIGLRHLNLYQKFPTFFGGEN